MIPIFTHPRETNHHLWDRFEHEREKETTLWNKHINSSACYCQGASGLSNCLNSCHLSLCLERQKILLILLYCTLKVSFHFSTSICPIPTQRSKLISNPFPKSFFQLLPKLIMITLVYKHPHHLVVLVSGNFSSAFHYVDLNISIILLLNISTLRIIGF